MFAVEPTAQGPAAERCPAIESLRFVEGNFSFLNPFLQLNCNDASLVTQAGSRVRLKIREIRAFRGSTTDTQSKLQPALLRLSAMIFPICHCWHRYSLFNTVCGTDLLSSSLAWDELAAASCSLTFCRPGGQSFDLPLLTCDIDLHVLRSCAIVASRYSPLQCSSRNSFSSIAFTAS